MKEIKKILIARLLILIISSFVLLQCKNNIDNTINNIANNKLNTKSEWFKIKHIEKKIWRIDDNGRVNIYLVEGEKKALLIDTGYGTKNPANLVKKITKLPVIVINTHNHPDHVGGNSYFSEIYAHPAALQSPKIKPVKENDIIDLGNRKLKIIEVPGHTPGSIAILDIKTGYLFSGDNNNTQVWLFLSNSLPLTTYLKSLQKLQKIYNNFNYILPGHGDKIDKSFIDEQVICVKNIITGKCSGKKYQTFIGPGLICSYKRASVVFNRSKIK